MEPVVVEIETQDQPEGTVLAQDPAPGEEVPEGTRVTLQVVGPAATIAIPDVAGQDQLSAAATLGRNFQVETEQEGSDTVPVGRVTRTDPPAGTMVPRDSVVKMFISAGSPITTMPDVVGLTESAASDRLTNAGLIMDVQFVNLSSDDSRVGIVITQDPGGRSEGRRRPHRHRRGRPGDRWRELDDVPERRRKHDGLVPAGYLTWLRKFANSWCPPTVSTDSGWNCTPSTACSR